MPETLPDLQPTPAVSSDDPFFAAVIQAVRRHEARAQRAEQLTGQPFRYSLSATADFSDLPVRRLRRLCRQNELQAFKLSGHWLLHRDEFMRLLDPASTLHWRTNRERQQIFVRYLRDLAAMLHPCEASCIINVLLKDLRRAVQARREGADYEDGEGFAWRRAEWRVRYGVVDPAQVNDALELLANLVRRGMSVFERIGWDRDATAALVSMVRAFTGIEVWL